MLRMKDPAMKCRNDDANCSLQIIKGRLAEILAVVT